MPVSDILRLRLGLDNNMTPQQIADQALVADREARRLERAKDPRALLARAEANAIADEFCRRSN